MSAEQVKKIRESVGLTQKEIANCLGLTQKTVSQYEMGFRKPGPTVQVVMEALDRVSAKQLKEILDIMKEVSEKIQSKSTKRKVD